MHDVCAPPSANFYSGKVSMKVIFLDIDGVLNTVKDFQRHNFIGMSPVLVRRFNKLVKDTGAKVILSSTWRHDKNWREVMVRNGLDMKFLGRTKDLRDKIRGMEIDEWLGRHNVDRYVILDDDTDRLPDQIHFKTDFRVGGLTKEICDKVKRYLNSYE